VKRSPLKRKTPLRSQAKKPKASRTSAPRCVVLRCKMPQRVLDRCRPHAMNRADELASEYIKMRDRRTCRVCGNRENTVTWAHVLRRNNARWLRHAPYNAVALCWSCHFKFTNDEAAWVDWIDEVFGGCRHKRLRLIRNKRDYDNEALERTLLRYGYEGRRDGTSEREREA